ncbi:MAG TPA: phosphoenolpyruvate-utilizing N-terminal domain-containing protein, partial [Blastocatellia bacterium]|nr:phosphoenolpyruvate-utilizing N-terminal domain-containing protein [Blastocatellia bacterium]
MARRNKTGRLEDRIEGIGICQGIAIGTAFLVDDPRGRFIRMRIRDEDLDYEVDRFHKAVSAAQEQLQKAKERLRQALGEDYAAILDAHMLMLQDRSIGR